MNPILEVVREQNKKDYRSTDWADTDNTPSYRTSNAPSYWADSTPGYGKELNDLESQTERALSQALRYRGLSGQQSNQLQGAAARDATAVARDAARDRSAIDADREFNNSLRGFWQQRELAREQRGGEEIERVRDRGLQSAMLEDQLKTQTGLGELQARTSKELEGIRGNTQRDVAALDLAGRLGAAQAQVFSSLFGSVGTGTPNARFWG